MAAVGKLPARAAASDCPSETGAVRLSAESVAARPLAGGATAGCLLPELFGAGGELVEVGLVELLAEAEVGLG